MLRWIVGVCFIMASASAFAAGVGAVTHLSGTLSAQRADGTVRILSQRSEVHNGDTLTTQRQSFAQINFTDGSSVTIRPNSKMKIERYSFNQNAPQSDGIVMRLLRGGLRSVTGLIGKRGNQDAYKIRTSAATIGIRGSTGDTMDCTEGCEGVTSKSGKLKRGVYHKTHSGLYIMETAGGSILIGPNEVGFSDDPNAAPSKLPADPGMGTEEMPFALGIGGGTGGAEECVVK
jgi:hypothetical protein